MLIRQLVLRLAPAKRVPSHKVCKCGFPRIRIIFVGNTRTVNAHMQRAVKPLTGVTAGLRGGSFLIYNKNNVEFRKLNQWTVPELLRRICK